MLSKSDLSALDCSKSFNAADVTNSLSSTSLFKA